MVAKTREELVGKCRQLAISLASMAEEADLLAGDLLDTIDALAATEQAPAASGKYDDVLLPFLALMRKELHANAAKGDRPGWLLMDRKTAVLEVHHHVAKLQKSLLSNDAHGILEHAADVANMAMMSVDVCGLLPAAPSAPEQAEAKREFTYEDMIAYGRLCWRQSRQTWPSEVEAMPSIEARFEPPAQVEQGFHGCSAGPAPSNSFQGGAVEDLVGKHVAKVGGSFQHTGTVVAQFVTTAGEQRVVLEFDAPVAGMLHVYRPDQVVRWGQPINKDQTK